MKGNEPMKTMTTAEFNAIPDFFHNGILSIEIDGKVYSKRGVYNLLFAMGMIQD